jgi:putative oxidoreductase
MESSTGFFAVWSPRVLSVLRIVAGALFLQHGTAKLFHVPHVASFDNVQLMSLTGVAGMLEIGGGLLLLIGLFTRPVAFVLSGEMAFAYFIEHIRVSFFPVINDGTAAIMLSFACLYLVFAGGGPISLDAMIRKKS